MSIVNTARRVLQVYQEKSYGGDCSAVFVPRKPKPADHNHIKFLYFLIFFFRQPVELTNILLLLSRASQSHSKKEKNKNKSSSSVYFCLSHSISSSLYFFLCYFKLETEQNEIIPSRPMQATCNFDDFSRPCSNVYMHGAYTSKTKTTKSKWHRVNMARVAANDIARTWNPRESRCWALCLCNRTGWRIVQRSVQFFLLLFTRSPTGV